MHAIYQSVVRYLPKDYSNHVVFVHLDGAVLALYVDSPEWSSRIRFLVPDVLRSIQNYSNYQYIKEIRLRVIKRLAPEPYFNKKIAKKHGISPETVELLENTAKNKSSPLGKSLLNLVKTLKLKSRN